MGEREGGREGRREQRWEKGREGVSKVLDVSQHMLHAQKEVWL